MDELTKYFMKETKQDIKEIKKKLDDLHEFKVSMIASARLTSLIVSGISGLVTLIVSTWANIKYGR